MRHTAAASGKETKKGFGEAVRRKWGLYSGLFVLLKKRLRLSDGQCDGQWRAILLGVLARFVRRLFPPTPDGV